MARVEGALARQLDFGTVPAASENAPRTKNRGLRLAVPSAVVRGPDKYKVLEHRRRQAQIKARRLLDLLA
jgi:hypothetical protein